MSVRNDDGTYHSQKVMNIEARPLELKPHKSESPMKFFISIDSSLNVGQSLISKS